MTDQLPKPSFIAGYLRAEALNERRPESKLSSSENSTTHANKGKVTRSPEGGQNTNQLRLTIDTDLRDKINETINLWQNDGADLGFAYPNYPAFCRAALGHYFDASRRLTEKEGVGPKKSVILRVDRALYEKVTEQLPVAIRSKIYDRILRTFLKKLTTNTSGKTNASH